MFPLLFLKLNSGFIKFMMDIFLSKNYSFPTLEKLRQVPYYKAAVWGSNPAIASISKLAA
jgi:hypothetical protein